MKNGDYYKHYKGGDYFFDSIALPLNGKRFTQSAGLARYHENTHDLELRFDDEVLFINSDVPHVIYQAKEDHDTGKIWAREVDDFFGSKEVDGKYVKRFTLK